MRLDFLRHLAPAAPYPVPTSPARRDRLIRRDDPVDLSATATALYELMTERAAGFTMTDARKLPPVIRAEQLLAGTAAMMQPLAYRDGFAVPVQPRIVTKPDPFRTRREFIAQAVLGLVEEGECFLRLGDVDDATGRAQVAYVLPWEEVDVQWDARRFQPVYRWRGLKLTPDVHLKHVAIGRRAGELRGHGALREGLSYLYPVKAAEDYAASVFSTGGLPQTLIQPRKDAVGSDMTAEEAAAVKAQYLETRTGGGAEVAVMGRDLEILWPGTDPQKAQMQEARAYGATVVSRLLGIPAALLHVETSGATITYTNPSGALDDLIKTTVLPTYLAPLEAVLSELAPPGQVVRFDLGEMERADIAGRFQLYTLALAGERPWMTVEEVRAAEGWSATDVDSHTFDPAPTVPAPQLEVPAA